VILAATSDTGFESVETTVLVILVVSYGLWFTVHRLRRARPELNVTLPLIVGGGLRLLAIAGVSAAGLDSLRGGDEFTFLAEARQLATRSLGTGYLPHGPFQLHVVLFALEMKILHMTEGGMRIVQVGLALLGAVLILAAVYDLAGSRAARLAAWLIAIEPASLFFDSAIHKDPNMELASGLVVFGGTMLWKRLDLRGILVCAVGGAIAVETRSYAGWFLVAGAAVVLLHASLRHLDRPMKAMPLIYGLIIAGFVATPVVLQASSHKNLQVLQTSVNANAHGIGEASATGTNGDNLALEQVNFSSRGAIITNLPKRMEELVLQPYPWQLADTSQRFGAMDTLLVYGLLLLLIRYAWLSRGAVFKRTAPIMYPMLFQLIAYSLSVGNAGTGFRYRTHLETLWIATVAILYAHAVPARVTRRVDRSEQQNTNAIPALAVHADARS
jgi:hypothetical protein